MNDDELETFSQKDVSTVQSLGLGNNKITHEGIIHFSKAQWANLVELRLCKKPLIKSQTILVLKDANIC
jgi:hypothetical protein